MKSLKGLLPNAIADTIMSYKEMIDSFSDSLDSKSFQYSLLRQIIWGYSEGKRGGNFQKLVEFHKYFPDKKSEEKSLCEDINLFIDYYDSDAQEQEIKMISEINENFTALDEDKLFYSTAKRFQTLRDLEVDYIDRWIKYNKLFGNPK
jgi:hypothetical protein